jgi:hypothetical protein
MATKSTIEPDEQAIMALQRFSAGAGEAKRTMYRRARELMRRHDSA